MVEEFAVFCGEADLHDTGCDDEHFVVPHARVDLERAANALERRHVTARLQTIGRDLEVLTDIVAVEHDVDATRVDRRVREHSLVVRNCNKYVYMYMYCIIFPQIHFQQEGESHRGCRDTTPCRNRLRVARSFRRSATPRDAAVRWELARTSQKTCASSAPDVRLSQIGSPLKTKTDIHPKSYYH